MKAAGNYRSLIRGVSEQAPELRPDGQVTEQVNMIPDPVQGLSRRFGSIFKAEKSLGISPAAVAAMKADTANWRTFDYFSQGNDYTICLRRAAKPGGSLLPAMVVFNRTTNEFLDVVRNVSDTNLDLLESGGASAITNVGKYVFMAGNTIVPTSTTTDVWGSNGNLTKALVWIRGGAYARTYKVTATKLDDSHVSFEYTTPKASFPGTLDTSGVPVYIPDASGATPGTAPTTLTGFDTLGYTGSFTLSHTPVAGTLSVIRQTGTGDSISTEALIEGVDWSYAAGDVTLSFAFLGGDLVWANYQYATAGTDPTVGYLTVTDTEALYIKAVNGFGVSTLTWKDWNPASLTARNGDEVMTNVYPAQPTTPSDYSWGTGSPTIVFHPTMVNNLHVTVEYTHTKTLPNPNYSKQVNDITNDFNTLVTQWIGTAAEAINPSNIAEQLKLAAITAGLTTATRNGPNVIFDNVKSLAVNDGGDGSLMRGVADEVASVDDVSTTHYVGKVVKVRGKNSKESFYLKATAKDRTVTTGYTEVIWVEGAGEVHTVNPGLIYGTVVGTDFFVASTATLLDAITTGPAPDYDASDAGDSDTNPLPYFVGRKITMLTVFQDRLLIGCGGVIRASKTAEYLNFFRSTVLSLPADDALEFLSQGSADDELRYAVLYDQNLVMFGLKRQYLVNGKVPLTPTNANMVPMSNHADAAELPPLAASGFIFYGKKGPSSSSVHQIQPGINTTSPDSFIISSQIDLYLNGDAIELSQIAKPSTLFLRTAGSRNSVYCFSYLDTQDGRKQDAWHRWDYATLLGPVIGMQASSEGLLVFTIRSTASDVYAVADLQVMTTGLSTKPYLDSNRALGDLSTGSWTDATAGLYVAFDASSEYRFLGDTLANADTLLETFPDATGPVVGAPYVATISPTNPFTRDDAGHAIIDGNLTVAKFTVKFTESSGYVYDVVEDAGTSTIEFNGRIFGDVNNIIGREPVSSYTRTMPIGRETRDFTLAIRSRDWFPFTITSVSWLGQYFNRTQRP